MKKIKITFSIAILSFIIITGKAQVNNKTIIADFHHLTGSWQGSLTYLDYSSGKPYTMPANVEIKRIEKTN